MANVECANVKTRHSACNWQKKMPFLHRRKSNKPFVSLRSFGRVCVWRLMFVTNDGHTWRARSKWREPQTSEIILCRPALTVNPASNSFFASTQSALILSFGSRFFFFCSFHSTSPIADSVARFSPIAKLRPIRTLFCSFRILLLRRHFHIQFMLLKKVLNTRGPFGRARAVIRVSDRGKSCSQRKTMRSFISAFRPDSRLKKFTINSFNLEFSALSE